MMITQHILIQTNAKQFLNKKDFYRKENRNYLELVNNNKICKIFCLKIMYV